MRYNRMHIINHGDEIIYRQLDCLLDCRRIRRHIAAFQKQSTNVWMRCYEFPGQLNEFLTQKSIVKVSSPL